MIDPYATNADPSVPELTDTSLTDSEMPGYGLIGMLGAGACGVVYRAKQHALNREVALKTIEVDGAIPPQVLLRFEKEAQALARLKHPNIVQVYEFGRKGQRVFLAMELLDGQDLEKRIQNGGPMDEPLAWRIARQTAAALAHAAAAGVFHRDVKPANLFLVPPPTGFPLPAGVPMVKVTDFGLALTRDSTDGSDQRLTRPGVTLGTPVYMAPEQFASPDVDHRADIYALGVSVCQSLTGHTPYDGATVWEVMKLKAQPPTLPTSATPGTRALLSDMLAADPEERVGSYEQLLARIDGVLNGDAPPPESVERLARADAARRPRLSRRAVLIGLGAVAAAGVAGAAAWALRPREPEAQPETLFSPDQPSVAKWPAVGGAWQVEKGPVEGTFRLVGTDPVTTRVIGGRAFRLYLELDPREAAGGVTVAIRPRNDGDPLAGDPLTEVVASWADRPGAVTLPSAAAGREPVVLVVLERIGGRWKALIGEKVVDDRPDPGTWGPFTLSISPDGGPVRIQSASVEPIIPGS